MLQNTVVTGKSQAKARERDATQSASTPDSIKVYPARKEWVGRKWGLLPNDFSLNAP